MPGDHTPVRRATRAAVAFDLLLDNVPTAAHPDKGDPAMVTRMAEIVERAAAEAAESGMDGTDTGAGVS